MICGKSRSGGFLVQRKTRRGRMQAKLREIKGELRRRRHRPISEQGRWLKGA
jgi:RNA-directed DNA polymerase